MEEKILEIFLYNEKLKFNEIEKTTGLRSNKLSYYIKSLLKKGILEKKNDYYKLSESAEYIIPYLSKKSVVIPVILVAITKQKNIFLYKRKKRPFMEKLSLPGGRMVINESIKKSTERIMKDKFNIKCQFVKTNSISLEHVKKSGKIINSFLLIFVSAKTNQKIEYYSLKQNKEKIISSDYELINKNLNKNIKIENIITNS